MKKLTALLLALLLALSAFALTSCGDDDKDGSETDKDAVETKKETYDTVDNDGWSPPFKP